MFNRESLILEQYPFEVRQISKGRGSLLCDTDQGLKILKEYKGSEGRAEFLHCLLEFLKESKSLQVDCIVRTKDGAAIAKDADGTAYMVRDWYEGKECDAKSRDDIYKAVGHLAGIHSILRTFPHEIPGYLQVRGDALLLENERHARELKKIRNYVNSRKKKNEFERGFLKNFSVFYGEAQRIIELQRQELEGAGLAEGERGVYGICHGDYNQHNVLFLRPGAAVLNFERASYDVQVGDLGNFMRKILEKHNWDVALGLEMLQAYRNVRPLSAQEERQLYIRLAFPEKFWKIANHYYNANKAWVCGRNLEKLDRFICQNEDREKFLRLMEENVI